MTERPIIFSAPMVRAILDGRKTQTRRILRPPKWSTGFDDMELADNGLFAIARNTGCLANVPLPCAVGDRLWVREMWRAEARFDKMPLRTEPTGAVVSYEADYNQEPNDGCRGRLRSSIHMPRWASRITLEVKAVRVQRLQDIMYTDTIAEGIEVTDIYKRREKLCLEKHIGCGELSRDSFRELWQSIHGPSAWDANPWVAAITFERVQDNK